MGARTSGKNSMLLRDVKFNKLQTTSLISLGGGVTSFVQSSRLMLYLGFQGDEFVQEGDCHQGLQNRSLAGNVYNIETEELREKKQCTG